jgi:type I restriction enzyme S subunit
VTKTALARLISPAAPLRLGTEASLPILSMTMHNGLVDQADKFKKRVASIDLSPYKVVTRGQLVVGFPIDEAVLAIQTQYEKAVVSPAYAIWNIQESLVDSRYLELFLRSPKAISYYKARLQGSTARRRSLPSSVFLEMEVPLPPVPEQRRIAAILDRADQLIGRDRRSLALLDELAESTFNFYFGDVAVNNRAWDGGAVLSEVAEVVSGITKGRRTSAVTREIPYLTVANVQDKALKLDVVKTIEATEGEIDRYRLAFGDLLLTEGGDPDKLGRGTTWGAELGECIHQNHVFRVRVTDSSVHPTYLSWLLGSTRGKRYFLQAAKQTTGIASINSTQLRGFPLLLPPRDVQDQFVVAIGLLNQRRVAATSHLLKLDEIFAALQHRAFEGTL